jgi:hypothetical protein
MGHIVQCAVALALPLLLLAANRIPLERAQTLVRAHVFATRPQMNPQALFPLKDITPGEVWDATQIQVFEVNDGVQVGYAYVIHNGHVYPAGSGLTSLAVADLDRNGQAELYCAGTWGSGILRGTVGAFVTTPSGLRRITSDHQFWWMSLFLESQADTCVAVYAADVRSRTDSLQVSCGEINYKRKVGKIRLTATDSGPELDLRLLHAGAFNSVNR